MTEELKQLDLRFMAHPQSDLNALAQQGPRIIDRAEGIYFYDSEGNKVIDGLACLWNVDIGHGWKEVAQAAYDQMVKLDFAPCFFGMASEPAIRLAEKLAHMAPGDLNRVFFTNSGSEANESAFKMARYAAHVSGKENKNIIVSRDKSYHGMALGATSATGLPNYHKLFGPLAPDFRHIRSPYCYRCPAGTTPERCGMDCANDLEKLIQEEGQDRVNSIIVDQIQATGGVIVPPDDYMPRIREICEKYDVNLITDEVITGFGRTGKLWASEQWGITPDIMTFAKGVTSGYLPLGGVVIKEDFYQKLTVAPEVGWFLHGFTTAGHPVCTAVGLANLEVMERERLTENARDTGAYMMDKLRDLYKYKHVGDVRGMGLIAAVELVADKETKDRFDPSLKVGGKVLSEAYKLGLNARAAGDIIELCPPMIITKSQVDDLVGMLDEAIKRATEQ